MVYSVVIDERRIRETFFYVCMFCGILERKVEVGSNGGGGYGIICFSLNSGDIIDR